MLYRVNVASVVCCLDDFSYCLQQLTIVKTIRSYNNQCLRIRKMEKKDSVLLSCI